MHFSASLLPWLWAKLPSSLAWKCGSFLDSLLIATCSCPLPSVLTHELEWSFKSVHHIMSSPCLNPTSRVPNGTTQSLPTKDCEPCVIWALPPSPFLYARPFTSYVPPMLAFASVAQIFQGCSCFGLECFLADLYILLFLCPTHMLYNIIPFWNLHSICHSLRPSSLLVFLYMHTLIILQGKPHGNDNVVLCVQHPYIFIEFVEQINICNHFCSIGGNIIMDYFSWS